MRKFLLMSVMAFAALMANADGLTSAGKLEKVKGQNVKAVAQQQLLRKANLQKAPQRAFADNCWYSRPIGSMAYGFGLDHMGYYNPNIVVTPYKEFTFDNQCTNPADANWFFINSTGSVDLSKDCDANNNLNFECGGAGAYYIPRIANNKVEYFWGEENRYNTAEKKYESLVKTVYEISPLRFSDPHLGQDLVGWGFLDTHFLFGDGGFEDDGTTRKLRSYAALQDFPKPMSPLYVENMFIELVTLDKQGNPLAEGDQLKMIIMDAEGNTLHELVCDPEDVIVDNEAQQTAYGALCSHIGVFSVKETDPISGEKAAAPFILDQAFTVVIVGFEGKGIGLPAHVYSDTEYAEMATMVGEDGALGFILVYDPADDKYSASFTFQDPICIPISFNSFFDNARVWDSAKLENGTVLDGINVLKVSADGETVENAGAADLGGDLIVETARSWFDAEENEQYYIATDTDEFPEWITGYLVDNSGWTDYDPEKENPDAKVFVSVKCDPLPESVEGRGAKVYVYGMGIKSAEPIYILQGNYTKEQCDGEDPSGISSVVSGSKKMNNKMYNVMGQQVSSNHKGIIIKNGKKAVVK